MHPDYFHNPPNFFPPPPREPKKSYYLMLFINSKNQDEKGRCIIYRRKTLDMLFDLIGDIDEQYYHTLYDNSNLTFLDQETRNENIFFRIIYSGNIVRDVQKYVNPNGYSVKFDWLDIPNTNYPNHFHVHPWPHIHKHPFPRPKPIGAPPLPRDYVGTQHDLANEYILRFGDLE